MSDDVFMDEKIIGYFDVDDGHLIISRVMGFNKSDNVVFGEIVFYKNEDVVFSLDISDAALLGDILSRNAKELYDDVVESVVSIVSFQRLDEELSSHNNKELI